MEVPETPEMEWSVEWQTQLSPARPQEEDQGDNVDPSDDFSTSLISAAASTIADIQELVEQIQQQQQHQPEPERPQEPELQPEQHVQGGPPAPLSILEFELEVQWKKYFRDILLFEVESLGKMETSTNSQRADLARAIRKSYESMSLEEVRPYEEVIRRRFREHIRRW